jgi:hypothetical protein
MQETFNFLRKHRLQVVSSVFGLATFAITPSFAVLPNTAAVADTTDSQSQLLKEKDQLMAKVKSETANAQDLKRLEEINRMLHSKLELSKDASLNAPSDLAPAAEVENPKQ